MLNNLNRLLIVFATVLLCSYGHSHAATPNKGDFAMSEPVLTLDLFNQPMEMLKLFNRLDASELDRIKSGHFSYLQERKRDDGALDRRALNDDGTIWEELTRRDSNYKYSSLYNTDGVLLHRSASFSRSMIFSTYYKPSGKMISLEDKQKDYRFKLADLRNMILKQFGLDILQRQRDILYVQMISMGEPPRPYYTITILNRQELRDYAYLIDGNNGEILYKRREPSRREDMLTTLERPPTFLEEYEQHLKEQNEPVKK